MGAFPAYNYPSNPCFAYGCFAVSSVSPATAPIPNNPAMILGNTLIVTNFSNNDARVSIGNVELTIAAPTSQPYLSANGETISPPPATMLVCNSIAVEIDPNIPTMISAILNSPTSPAYGMIGFYSEMRPIINNGLPPGSRP
jgi:hypothetical protein